MGGKYRRSQSPSLNQCLGLPTKPEKARLRLRNANLCQAAKLLPVDQSNHAAVAKMLALEVRRFMHHRWLIWNKEETPPTNASDLNRLIFMAAQHGGGALPTTPRQYITIIYEK